MHQKFRFGCQPADLYLELTGESLWVKSAKIANSLSLQIEQSRFPNAIDFGKTDKWR
jgi:hypothetical protein